MSEMESLGRRARRAEVGNGFIKEADSLKIGSKEYKEYKIELELG